MPGIPLAALPNAVPTVPAYWRFPAELASVPRARRAVADALPRPCRAQLSYELRLLTSELVTNAIRYGAQADDGDEMIELVFWTADNHHWLAVSDPGSGRPVLRTAAPDACGGRGLLLVEALSDAWGVVARPTRGKSVVAGIRLHGHG
ncbi:anti-sigma regulatory factor (Ser/Thr protein kinase) [Kitasatospora sp. MAP12-15]|uniref:ATP-binding protein n=1 Tax=unclassified Kitasatospora TaxID=2633591 RepID=UPI00247546AF|nr:ATP-binding protein [Kitasatospora sp. MAP12-44]MDH6109773.1 anti-sigma regulatory factor (Ser/Thr protein kinase) [Kitasatospora sp. MAP12-44]